MSSIPISEYQSVRQAAGFFDRSSQGKIILSGRDRASYLHALLTNDIVSLKAGTGCYAAYLTPQGRMIGDMRVVELGDRILLDVVPSVAGLLADRFNKLIFSEDVQVTNATAELAEFAIHGPQAADVIEKVSGLPAHDLLGLAQCGSLCTALGEAELIVVRDDSLGEPGFDAYIAQAEADPFRRKALLAGAVECSAATAEVLRIEAGRPLFGVDMDNETIPLEAGIEDRAISFTKGCYVGQEVIIRVMHRGHGRVARKLVGLVVDGADVPATPAKPAKPAKNDEIVVDERHVGHVTSAAHSPVLGTIALGYVQRDYVVAGTEVAIMSGSQRLPARVSALPFRLAVKTSS